ncbi:MAG: hypothetical protein A3F10_05675 [Coxiella sp. RIFCSPHIGHO2_12_FULL_42_15]|nr:MAG: hypothetical protein A3F10_05675 [Coxiella sp. RIFCSPHIGHO2_12_FULL_42_15]
MESIIVVCVQLIGWIAAFISAYYSLKTQVDRNKMALDSFKHQVDERMRLLEQQCDRVYHAIETMNNRIDQSLKMLISHIQNKI